MPGRGWAKVASSNLYLNKCVQLADESVYVIGGATDQKSVQAVNTVTQYRINQGRVIMEEKATMILARSNYGATVNAHTNEIYVAGGYTNNSLMTRRCEAYNVASNTWRELP